MCYLPPPDGGRAVDDEVSLFKPSALDVEMLGGSAGVDKLDKILDDELLSSTAAIEDGTATTSRTAKITNTVFILHPSHQARY